MANDGLGCYWSINCIEFLKISYTWRFLATKDKWYRKLHKSCSYGRDACH